MNRTDIINELCGKFPWARYLGIGVLNTDRNFTKICAGFKYGVDPCLAWEGSDDPFSYIYPMTSNVYFEKHDHPFPYDVIFIDGDHSHEQSRRDFRNALDNLTVVPTPGYIVLHDCLPKTAGQALPEKGPGHGGWCGEVWKTWRYIRSRADLKSYVVDVDHGCGIVQRGKNTNTIPLDDANTWRNAGEWANVVSENDAVL